MSKPTLQQRYVSALQQVHGCKIVKPPRFGTNYIILTNALRPDSKTYFFVGASGAIRVGEAPGRSVLCSERFKVKLLEDMLNLL